MCFPFLLDVMLSLCNDWSPQVPASLRTVFVFRRLGTLRDGKTDRRHSLAAVDPTLKIKHVGKSETHPQVGENLTNRPLTS